MRVRGREREKPNQRLRKECQALGFRRSRCLFSKKNVAFFVVCKFVFSSPRRGRKAEYTVRAETLSSRP